MITRALFSALAGLISNRYALIAAALIATHGGAWWHGYDTRRDSDAARVAQALAAERVAQARILGMADAQAQVSAERDRLREDLDNAALADSNASRVCLGADSVRRLGSP